MTFVLELSQETVGDKHQKIERFVQQLTRCETQPLKATFYFKEETKVELAWHLKHLQALWVNEITLKVEAPKGRGVWLSKLNTRRSARSLHDFPLATVTKVLLEPYEEKVPKKLKELQTIWKRKHPALWKAWTPALLATQLQQVELINLETFFSREDLEYADGSFAFEDDFSCFHMDQLFSYELMAAVGDHQEYQAWFIKEELTTRKQTRYLVLNATEAILLEV